MGKVSVNCRSKPVPVSKLRPMSAARPDESSGAAGVTPAAKPAPSNTSASWLPTERARGEPDEAVNEHIVNYLERVGGPKGFLEKMKGLYVDCESTTRLRDSLPDVFSKAPRAGVSWSTFDARPSGKSAMNAHLHPTHLNFLPEILQDMSPYMPDVARAIREIVTNGVTFTLNVRPAACPALAAAPAEAQSAFTWGPDDNYASYVHFLAVLVVCQVFRTSALPGARRFPAWLVTDLEAIPAQYDVSKGPMERCSKLVRKSMYLAAQNREFDDFMMFNMAKGNGWRQEEEVMHFVKKHNSQNVYEKSLQLPPHMAKRVVLMARAADDWHEKCAQEVGKAGSMASAGLQKGILSNAVTYPGHCFTKSSHALFKPICTTTLASSLLAITELFARGGRFDNMPPESFALACKSLAMWCNLKDGVLKRLGAREEAMLTTYAKIKSGKYDAENVQFCREFDEDTTETDVAQFDKYLASALGMVEDAMRLSTEELPQAASAAAFPAGGVGKSNEDWWTERFEFEVKKYDHWHSHRHTVDIGAQKAEEQYLMDKRKHALEATKGFASVYTEIMDYATDVDFTATAGAWRENRIRQVAEAAKCSEADVLVCVLHNFGAYRTCSETIFESGRSLCNTVAGASGLALYVQSGFPANVRRAGKKEPLGTAPANGSDDENPPVVDDFPGLPVSAAAADVYKDNGQLKALLAKDFRKLEELGDGTDSRYGEPSVICFEDPLTSARKGKDLARPPLRVLGVQPAKNSPWMTLSFFKSGRLVAAPPREFVSTDARAAIKARKWIIETKVLREASKHDRHQLGDDFFRRICSTSWRRWRTA